MSREISAEQMNPSGDSAAMSDSVENIRTLELKPLPYHEAMRDYLKEEEADVWHWYASNKVRDEQAEAVRFELLKSTYRVERQAQPETYAAAEDVARKLWADREPQSDRKIQEMLEGRPALNHLDLLAQRKVAGLTRRLLDALLWRRWMQTEPVLAHACLFFEDYVPPEDLLEDPALAEELRTDDQPMQDYYGYVLLDFVTADRDLEELPLAAALVLAEKLGLKDRFTEIAKRELRLRKKQLETIDQDKEKLLAKANEGPPP